MLLHFEPSLRGQIASGRFTTSDDVRLVERDDGGRDLWVYKPFFEKQYPFPEPSVMRVVRTDEMGFCNEPGTYDAQEGIGVFGLDAAY